MVRIKRVGKAEGRDLGSCKAEPDQQRFLPGTLNPTFNFPKDSVRSRPRTDVGALGALPAQGFLPTAQDTVPLTWS